MEALQTTEITSFRLARREAAIPKCKATSGRADPDLAGGLSGLGAAAEEDPHNRALAGWAWQVQGLR